MLVILIPPIANGLLIQIPGNATFIEKIRTLMMAEIQKDLMLLATLTPQAKAGVVKVAAAKAPAAALVVAQLWASSA